MKNIYCGAGGVGWGLERLRASGHAETALDLLAVAQRALARFRKEPDYLQGEDLPTPTRSSLFMGEAGLVFVAWLLEPSDELATELLELVRQNVGNASNELMWGVPGTLLIARVLHARTGEERWRAAVEESVQALYDERDDDGLWTQKLYGHTSRTLGPIHGFVGNVAALGDTRRVAEILRRNAIVEGGHAFFHNRHIAGRNCRNEDFRRGWSDLSRLSRTACNKQPADQEYAERREAFHGFVIVDNALKCRA